MSTPRSNRPPQLLPTLVMVQAPGNACFAGAGPTYDFRDRTAHSPHARIAAKVPLKCPRIEENECQPPEMLNGRCRMHGGTSAGAPKGTAMHGSIAGESYPPTVVRRGRPRGAFLGCSTLFECCGPLQSVSPWWQETEIGNCLGRRRDSAERAPVRAARAAPLASSLRQFYWWRG